VHVTNLEAGALARQTTGSERRQTTTVRQARQRVHLVHQLRQLAGSEELLDGRLQRTDVHERGRGDGLGILGGHALAHDALHARQTDAHLVLDELAHRTDATVREVILVVEAVAGLLLDEVEHVRDGREDLVGTQHVAVLGIALDGTLVGIVHVDAEVLTQLAGALTEQLVQLVQFLAQLAVDLVATDARQVVALGIEERVLEVGARRLERRRLTRAGALVDLDESLVLRGGDVALLVPLTLNRARDPRRSRARATA